MILSLICTWMLVTQMPIDHFLFSSENLKVEGLDFGAAYYENDSGLICVTSDHPIMRLQVSVKS